MIFLLRILKRRYLLSVSSIIVLFVVVLVGGYLGFVSSRWVYRLWGIYLMEYCLIEWGNCKVLDIKYFGFCELYDLYFDFFILF